jgi:hypothetical protein
MRCDSPPERVPAARESVRYSRPTSFRKARRSRISFRMRVAISVCCFVKVFGTSLNHSLAFLIERSPTSPMCLPPTFTARA